MKPTEITTKVRDAAGRFFSGHPIGTNTRWRNTSDNPAGNPRSRRAFAEQQLWRTPGGRKTHGGVDQLAFCNDSQLKLSVIKWRRNR
jgi:hypothetical protein